MAQADAAGAESPTEWRILVDAGFRRDADAEMALRLGVYGDEMTFVLANHGPHPATGVALEFPDPKQVFSGPLEHPGLEPKHAFRFRATRRIFGDNALRVRWFQSDPALRYWTTLYLPRE